MTDYPALTVITFLPLVGGLAVLCCGDRLARWIATATTVAKICTNAQTNKTHVVQMTIPLSPSGAHNAMSEIFDGTSVQWVRTAAGADSCDGLATN